MSVDLDASQGSLQVKGAGRASPLLSSGRPATCSLQPRSMEHSVKRSTADCPSLTLWFLHWISCCSPRGGPGGPATQAKQSAHTKFSAQTLQCC